MNYLFPSNTKASCFPENAKKIQTKNAITPPTILQIRRFMLSIMYPKIGHSSGTPASSPNTNTMTNPPLVALANTARGFTFGFFR